MSIYVLKGSIVNVGQIVQQDIFIDNGRIRQAGPGLHGKNAGNVIDAEGKPIAPGMIDDPAHFREPGLTHKGGLTSESWAIAGGIASVLICRMSNHPLLLRTKLKEKFRDTAGITRFSWAPPMTIWTRCDS